MAIAHDGPSGLQAWKAFKPHLIVLDIMLPGIDGLSILQSIRLEDERLPVLILSAKGAKEDIIKGLAYGVDDYLAKPVDLDELAAAIAEQYPDDRAVGYGEGQLRGWFWVDVPAVR